VPRNGSSTGADAVPRDDPAVERDAERPLTGTGREQTARAAAEVLDVASTAAWRASTGRAGTGPICPAWRGTLERHLPSEALDPVA
jgi:hypothetical protein